MIESSNGGKDFSFQGRFKNGLFYTASPKKFEGERKVLCFPKDCSTLDCEDSCLVLMEVQTPPRIEHPVIEDIWTTKGSHQHIDEQENGEHKERQARESTTKNRKNHPAKVSKEHIGDLERSV